MTTRKQIREALAIVLQNGLSTVDDTKIYEGQIISLDGRTPLVIVASAGSDRTGTGQQGRATLGASGGNRVFPAYFFDIYCYALSTVDADDYLDTIENEMAQAIEDNQNHILWKSITYREPSRMRGLIQSDGAQYKYEVTPLRILSS